MLLHQTIESAHKCRRQHRKPTCTCYSDWSPSTRSSRYNSHDGSDRNAGFHRYEDYRKLLASNHSPSRAAWGESSAAMQSASQLRWLVCPRRRSRSNDWRASAGCRDAGHERPVLLSGRRRPAHARAASSRWAVGDPLSSSWTCSHPPTCPLSRGCCPLASFAREVSPSCRIRPNNISAQLPMPLRFWDC